MGFALRSLVPALGVAASLACTAGADRRATNDTAGAGVTAGAQDSIATAVAPPRASDATLTLLTAAPLTPALRIAAESFALREAVLVVIDTLPELGTSSPDTIPRHLAGVVALPTSELVARFVARQESSWWLPFASNRVVVAWSDSARRPIAIDSASWPVVVARRATRVGRADPATSALGAHTLLVMQLAEKSRGERGLAARLQRAGAASVVGADAGALSAGLRTGTFDFIWTYESLARAEGLRYLRLGDDVDLGDAAHAARYAEVSLTLPRVAGERATARDTAATVRADSLVVRGAPLRYALTVPHRTANLALAERFVRYLFSGEGRRIMQGGDFTLDVLLVAVGREIPDVVVGVADSVAPPSIDEAVPDVPRP